MGIAVALNGTIYVVDPDYLGDGTRVVVLSINPTTGAQTRVTCGDNLSVAYGIALDANGNIFVGNRGGSSIVEVNPRAGAQTVVSSGGMLFTPDSLAVATDGTLLVADHDAFNNGINAGGVIEVNPVTGAQTALSDGYFSGGPGGIALDPTGNIFVSDANAADIVMVNPTTGRHTVVSSGGDLVNPYGIAYVDDVQAVPAPSSLVMAGTAVAILLAFARWRPQSFGKAPVSTP